MRGLVCDFYEWLHKIIFSFVIESNQSHGH